MNSAARPSIDPVRWRPPPVGSLPDFGPAELSVVPMPGDAPEDVVVGPDGALWTGLVDGRIVRIDPDGAEPTVRVVGDVPGRPLGLAVARDGRLLICTSPGGLLAMDVTGNPGRTEVLADSVDFRPLNFCSNVVEVADGTIYFTESTAKFSYAHFKGAIFEARGDGSLNRLGPDGAHPVLTNLYFANGLTQTADGSALVFAETQARRLSKYWLTGPKAGTVTRLAENLPGMPDNISTGADGRIWVAMVSRRNAAADILAPRAPILRTLIWRLPERLQPQIAPEVWAVAFDPDTGAAVAGLRMTHPDFGVVTGLVEHRGRLWMSSIGFPALAHCALPQ
ncbi:MAG TPA: SMP-30/gluconolactonase/LRE family protein [Mycobacterium sp.]|nr:MAG: SMP-30/gluconolactonase/LRE family protein [Mycobacterium sp.]HOB50139.1 SMP-30/gluconolactonase/LRE family protein [Mycobacterium sp.]HPZ94557.1 SMP-30/gluconolactonase/LRE family protein [Mycobacterium sp.]HQE16092.1 SMP-30/gluconolactonase/LRE family protein [Mycobacterium sp.]